MKPIDIPGISYRPDFISGPQILFENLVQQIDWDDRMAARKTASYGKAYNYSQIAYPDCAFPENLELVRKKLIPELGFEPNNCLINYYLDGSSKMGFHSDQTDILEPGTGIAIISLGAARIMRFKRISNPEMCIDHDLESGSLFYMDQEVQREWLHAIPKATANQGRLSLTFRRLL